MACWLVVSDLPEAQDARFDYIVVLAGAAHYRERTREAAHLWREGVAPQIVLTNDGLQGGWSSPLQRNPYFIERARWELEARGVPKSQIIELPGNVHSTRDEALAVKAFAERIGAKSFVVVTSPYHTRRASWILKRVMAESGVQIRVHAAFSDNAASPLAWWLSADGWRDVGVECVKLAYYRFVY